MQTNFRTVLFGYSKKQVNEFIGTISREHEDNKALKNERFVELRDQNNIMKAELADYKRKEQEISSVLIKAREVATEMIQEGERSAISEKDKLMEEIHQLDKLAQVLYQKLETMMQQASDTVSGFEQDLKELNSRKEAFLKVTAPNRDDTYT
jgi:cell division septum initiation protein DivIVA